MWWSAALLPSRVPLLRISFTCFFLACTWQASRSSGLRFYRSLLAEEQDRAMSQGLMGLLMAQGRCASQVHAGSTQAARLLCYCGGRECVHAALQSCLAQHEHAVYAASQVSCPHEEAVGNVIWLSSAGRFAVQQLLGRAQNAKIRQPTCFRPHCLQSRRLNVPACRPCSACTLSPVSHRTSHTACALELGVCPPLSCCHAAICTSLPVPDALACQKCVQCVYICKDRRPETREVWSM